MLTALGILLGIVVVSAITALTGYFVAQEFAYMAVDRSRLKARAQAGDIGATRALQVTRRTSFMLSGAQLGITVTGLLVGYVAEPLIGKGLGELLGGVGVPLGLGIAIGTVLAMVFSTVVQMVFGELFPKNLAIARPEPVARWLALSTNIYLAVFGWLIKLFDASSNLLLRALRIEPVHDVEHSATARDLEHIVADSREAGDIPEELSTLLDRILDFPTRTTEHAMIPRARVDVVGADEPVGAVLAKMASGHTRYPVIGATPDDLVGVVHLHDLLGAADPSATAGENCRPAVIVPETLPLPSALRALSEARDEMALVIDEYGGFAGVLTIEDLAEELVGEIDDEHDKDSADDDVVPTGDGWLVRGDVALDELSRVIGHDLPEGDYETLAGLLIAEFGGLPGVGDAVSVDLGVEPAELIADHPPLQRRLDATVQAVEKHVPARVLVSLADVPVDAVQEGTGDE
ncbi:hemolysin family protein [Arthrobacter sp. SLBN-53]|uniref:hemolysin family protein n=1 Tax=Arthrobacter sp. SLBN-53 TaxID=2768412 RepID=UPI0011540192|nr:hemolysin family protein [Arthrobacter sp. SLBN-53]TQK31719.1 CBS domain containing-hemolysin-like protein [Arthrobacter sp. SLBN-53]